MELTVIMICRNQKDEMIESLSAILEMPEITDILVIDNGSSDGTVDTLISLGANYIQFDEGKQSYGKIINVVRENVPLKKYVLFINPGFCIDKESLLAMIDTLDIDGTGITGPLYTDADWLPQDLENCIPGNEALYSDALAIGGYVWMIKEKTLMEGEEFCEELMSPGQAMLDYGFMLLRKGLKPRICEKAVAARIGDAADTLEEEQKDWNTLAKMYQMTYFNCKGNYNICDQIIRDKQESFSVLEIGCDLGATLLEIKRRYPNSVVKGLEINPNAVNLGRLLLDIREGNIEKKELPFSLKFDYIIFGDVLEHLHI